MDKKTVIFTNSYPQIKNTLYLLDNAELLDSVTIVITGYASLYQFYQVLNEKTYFGKLNIVFIPRYTPKRGPVTGFSDFRNVISDIVQEKKHLDRSFRLYFQGMENTAIYFFNWCYCPYTYYFIKRLYKRNEVSFIPDPSMDAKTLEDWPPDSFYEYSSRCIAKLIFGPDIIRRKYLSTEVSCISPRFIRNSDIRVNTPRERDEKERKINTGNIRLFDVSDYLVVFCDSDIVSAGYVETDIYQTAITRIIEVLLRFIPKEKLAVKYHPGFSGDRIEFAGCSVIPNYLPAEMLYSDSGTIYISIMSAAMIGYRHGPAISLLYLVNIRDEATLSAIRGYLEFNNDRKILFPKTLDELATLVDKYTGSHGEPTEI